MPESAVSTDAQARCPVADVQWEGPKRPALAGYALTDQLRALGPVVKVPEGVGFYLLTRHQESLMAAQDPDTFPQWTTILATGEPMPFLPIPEQLDGHIHTQWRRLLSPHFSPRAASRWKDRMRQQAVELIDDIGPRGRCDFIAEFASRFPTLIFLEFMGLPTSELDQMLGWERDILHWDIERGPEVLVTAQSQVVQYFGELITERRAMSPDDRPAGLVTEALEFEIEGRPVSDDELVRFYLLMFMAGLDTVSAELGYGFLHLATHPEDRRQIVQHPELIPNAVEELLRLYPIVNPPREVAKDTEIAGCPIRKGEFITLSLPGAGRDSDFYRDALRANFEHPAPSHLTFGAGPHRCLGAHLARHELTIAYEEWHARIPDYRVDDDVPAMETAGQLYSLDNLPLRWDGDQ